MPEKTTFIKIDRCLLNKPIFQNEKLFRVWMWCLMRANYRERTHIVGLKEITLNPGQFITGRYAGAQELKLNPSTFWKHLKWLEKNQSIELKSNNKFTVVSVVNWHFYQLEEYKNDSKITAKEQQNDTDNKVNKGNKFNKNSGTPPTPLNDIAKIVKSYEQINPVMTYTEKEKLMHWLDEGMDADVVIWAIEQAILNGKRNMAYIEGILRRLLADNILTIQTVNLREGERKKGEPATGHFTPDDAVRARQERLAKYERGETL